jgi:hypothetical protein
MGEGKSGGGQVIELSGEELRPELLRIGSALRYLRDAASPASDAGVNVVKLRGNGGWKSFGERGMMVLRYVAVAETATLRAGRGNAAGPRHPMPG